ncbi:MAG: 4Fe-4S binding protein [Anaerolineae bacterium]|nr:4Fe-4S binding protein [Anaerolineae bacterium]
MKLTITWAHWRRVRRAVQLLFFALFVYLVFAGLQRQGGTEVNPLSDLFFRLNPLSALVASLASRGLVQGLGWALITIGATLLAGRVWCGWVCPTGTLLEWVSFRGARRRAARLSPRLRSIKYLLLVAIIVMALLGNATLLIFEPLALLTRVMTTVAVPSLNYAITAGEKALYPISFLRPAIDWVEGALRGSLLPAHQPVFGSSLLIAALFGVIVALNLLADCFWCRYLCPLGALLGWVSKIAIFRPAISSACNGCTRCAITCKPGAIHTVPPAEASGSGADIAIQPTECTVCLDCLAGCAKDGMAMKPIFQVAPTQAFDPTRRQFLQAGMVGAAGVVLLRADLRLRTQNSLLIRPPGVDDEIEFLAKCLRCSECMKVCPTTALQPAKGEAGLEGLWTPIVTPRVGYCDYGCNACGQVCPSKAIPLLSLDEKRRQVIGKASVNRDRCLPWASNTPCIVCEEMCPLPEKAIKLEVVTVPDAFGGEMALQRPYVVRDLCIGCGICENRCPLEGEAAIRVYGTIT